MNAVLICQPSASSTQLTLAKVPTTTGASRGSRVVVDRT
jgi:hypothetical protein